MIQTYTNQANIKKTFIKTLHDTTPNTHLSQHAFSEVLHGYMLTPLQNLVLTT